MSATTLLFLRMTLSLPFFAAVAWWLRREPPLARRDWLGIVGHFALIGGLGPVTTVLADFALLQGALTPLQLLGGALVIAGVLLVSLKKG